MGDAFKGLVCTNTHVVRENASTIIAVMHGPQTSARELQVQKNNLTEIVPSLVNMYSQITCM